MPTATKAPPAVRRDKAAQAVTSYAAQIAEVEAHKASKNRELVALTQRKTALQTEATNAADAVKAAALQAKLHSITIQIDDSEDAQAAHDAAQVALEAATARSEKAQATLAELAQTFPAQAAALRQTIEEDNARLSELQQQAEHAHALREAAHTQAGLDELGAIYAEHTAMLADFEQFRERLAQFHQAAQDRLAAWPALQRELASNAYFKGQDLLHMFLAYCESMERQAGHFINVPGQRSVLWTLHQMGDERLLGTLLSQSGHLRLPQLRTIQRDAQHLLTICNTRQAQLAPEGATNGDQ